jgi:molybdenum-dependent DNA-binding transcriptional regulator ModE
MSRKELIELLTQLLGTLPQRVLQHIDIMAGNGITYKEMARAVFFMHDVLHQPLVDLDKWGLKGTVPLYVERANKYYDNLKRQQEEQRRQVDAAKDLKIRDVCPQPRVKRKKGVDINEL